MEMCHQNLGSLLLEFFELYGTDFNYITTGISVRNGGSYFPKGSKEKRDIFWQPSRPFSLALENPIDFSLDVGKGSYRMKLIQYSFFWAFNVLLAHISEPRAPSHATGGSILATILPPTKEMEKRALMQKGSKKAGGLVEGVMLGGNPKLDGNDHCLFQQEESDMDCSSNDDIDWGNEDEGSSNDGIDWGNEDDSITSGRKS
eukprot:CAMPEP_0195539840 /NCGR_PEP_ID=MMETSP0794_2-20130614/50267_1 /TAXON_ID=515487 /ORGANISM="Stephanopyxis turris, Strain CCMP 815" /LENGTH=201 /DNA_ID=CAMNT_0040673895 /DNA_START=172 /DNA_END=777 /DNA_ORIENTATION=+